MENHIIWSIMALCGILTHFAKHLIQARNNGSTATAWSYWKDNRLESIVSIIGTVALYFLAMEQGMLNGFTAFAAGVMGNSAADVIGKRANKIGG